MIGKNGLAEVFDDLLLIPPVMRLFARRRLEAHGGIGDRAATLELLMAHEASCHSQTLRPDRTPVNPVLRCPQHCISLIRRSSQDRNCPSASSPADKSLRGSRGPGAGVRGIPSPFIKIYARGRDTPHPSLLPLVPMRKDSLAETRVDAIAPSVGRARTGARAIRRCRNHLSARGSHLSGRKGSGVG